MNERYEELVRRAVINGDASAADQLIKIGERHQGEGRFEDAAKMYKAVAGANLMRGKDVEHSAAAALDIYRRRFDAHLCELRDWSGQAHKVDREYIRRVVVEQLWSDQQFAPIFAYLEDVLTELGMQFYSPGGSVPRRVWLLLTELLGVEKRSKELSKYLDSVPVRVGLDLLASEVVKRCDVRQAAGEA